MAEPSPSPPPPAPVPVGSSSAGSASGRRHRRWLVPAGALLVAVALLVGGLVATGVVPLLKGPASPPPFAPTFQGAASEGQPTANSVPGGPWGAALGLASRVPISLTVPTGNLTGVKGVDGCNATLTSDLPKDVVVQATPTSAGAGASAFWVVLYVNDSGGAVGIMVNGGVSSELFTLEGTSCAKLTNYLAPFPSGSPDSPTIVRVVNAAGGSAFLAAHPNATEVIVGASVVIIQPVWEVVYTTCTLSPIANASGSEFNATVVGTTVENHSAGPVSCSLPAGTTLPTLAALLPGAPALGKAI